MFYHFHEGVIQRFEQYQLPVIEMSRETPKEAVCLVFEKVNTGGVSLTVFESENILEVFSKVSILVVLDQPLRPYLQASFLQLTLCFNPCCSGSASSTVASSAMWLQYSQFQSLLFWISLFDSFGLPDWREDGEFQSLLFWISLFDLHA